MMIKKSYLSIFKPLLWGILFACFFSIASCKTNTEKQSSNAELLNPPTALKISEGFTNPVGFYDATPTFSWLLPNANELKAQAAYQIQMIEQGRSFDEASLFWDSARVQDTDSAWRQYTGPAIDSRQQLIWRVRFWDQNNRVSAWSNPASFEVGLLHNDDWQGKWISVKNAAEADPKAPKYKLYRPQYLRKAFSLQGEVAQARLYTTARGVFEARLNGEKVSHDVMTPGWTPYKERIETLTYDVTSLLLKGENVFGLMLAEGWYTGRVLGKDQRQLEPPPPYVLAQLEIEYKDGSKKIIVTDKSWKATKNGPIRFASNYDGEVYDANMDMPGWAKVGFDDSAWTGVITQSVQPLPLLQPKRHYAVTDKLTLTATDILPEQDGRLIFDMGQNMVGVPIVRVPVLKGKTLVIEFAEALEKGAFYNKNYRSAHSTNYYTPKVDGIIEYKPTFTFHGYRYVAISGFDNTAKPELDWVKSAVQHSDFEMYSDFGSSHEKLNKLYENVTWGLRGNFFDIPTDCPQRDERLGWTGDAQVFAPTSMYIADVYSFWASWLQSMREDQLDNGLIRNVIPYWATTKVGHASSGWGDAATVIPWELYTLTGDVSILKENYEMMTRWLMYHDSQLKDSISHMQSYADWLQPYPEEEGRTGQRGDTDKTFISTAYYARSLELSAKAALALGRDDDAKKWSDKRQAVKTRFIDHFFDAQLNVKQGKSTQTAYLMALNFDLLEPKQIPLARTKLIELIEQADYHLRTGFLGTPLLAPVLQKAGQSNLMYQLLFKETYPSWFYSINQGATTTWERWNSYSIKDGFSKASMNSLNHYAYGAVAEWFYEGILGIQPVEPGFKTFSVNPQVGEHLDNAKGTVHTPYGAIAVEWQKSAEAFSLDVEVPPNTMADILIPATSLDLVKVNGLPANSHKDMRLSRQGDGILRARVSAGNYSIDVFASVNP